MRSLLGLSTAGWYVFAAGLAAGLAQVVLFRELLVVATGTELVVGLLLAVWLMGAAVGSYWAERGTVAPDVLGRRAWKLSWVTGPALALGVLTVRASRPLLAVLPNAFAEHLPAQSKIAYFVGRLVAVQSGETLGLFHIIAVAVASTTLAAFCCGAQFVTGARLLRPAGGAGRAYAVDALGHLLGGVTLAFAATVWLDGLWIAAVVTPLLVAAGWAILPSRRRISGVVTFAALLALCVMMALLGSPSRRWRWPQQQVLAERASIFGLVTVTAQQGGGVYFLENGVPSGESPPTPRMEVLVNYALLHVDKPRRVLLIGGGVSGGVVECLKHRPEQVDYVEFDPVFLELARQWAHEHDRRALLDRRVRCFACDPRLLLAQAEGEYDAIILALPTPTTALLNRFFTREGFALYRKGLRAGGVVAFLLPYSQVYHTDLLAELDRCLYHSAGTETLTAPPALLAGDELTVVMPLGASASSRLAPALTRPDDVEQRLARRSVAAPYLAALAWDWLDPQNREQALAMLADSGPPNTDLRPVGYLLGTAYWLAQVTPTAGAALLPLLRQSPRVWSTLPWLLAVPMLLAAIAVLVSPGRFRRFGAWTLMASVGLAGMAMQTALLLLMQSWHGYIYELIGIVVGTFMVGVSLGALAAEEGVPRRLARVALEGACLVALALGLYAWLVLHGPVPAWGLPLLAVVPGAFVGFAFPMAVRRWSDASGHGIGVIYAADLLGGVVGALTVPGLFLPLAGVVASALAPTAGAAALFLVLFARRE